MNGDDTDAAAIRGEAAMSAGRDETLEILQYRKDTARPSGDDVAALSMMGKGVSPIISCPSDKPPVPRRKKPSGAHVRARAASVGADALASTTSHYATTATKNAGAHCWDFAPRFCGYSRMKV